MDAGFDHFGFLELHAIPQHNEKGLGMPHEGYDPHTDGAVAKDEQLPPWHLMAYYAHEFWIYGLPNSRIYIDTLILKSLPCQSAENETCKSNSKIPRVILYTFIQRASW